MLTKICRTMLLNDSNLCYNPLTNPEETPKTVHIDNSDDDPSICFWDSPLTTKWHDKHARTCLEIPIAALGRLMHSWVATFLDETDKEIVLTESLLRRRRHLRREIERFIDVVVPVKNAEMAMLACCHWATSIMLKVDQYGISICQAAQLTPIRPRLVTCLRLTDLSSLWDNRRGMLFWVVTVCHHATRGQCFPLLTTALQTRFAHVLALSKWYHAMGVTPLSRLCLFERLCWTSREQSLVD